MHYPNLGFLSSLPYEYLLFPFLMMMFQLVCMSRKKAGEMRLLDIRSQNVLISIALKKFKPEKIKQWDCPYCSVTTRPLHYSWQFTDLHWSVG